MSLLESCIGAAVISTLTMIALPTILNSRDDYTLAASARQVAAKLQAARIKAITRNRDCRVRVTSQVSFSIECLHSSWLRDEDFVLHRGLTLTANAVPRFHRRGSVAPSATFTIWNARGRHKRVIVNITGRVRVE